MRRWIALSLFALLAGCAGETPAATSEAPGVPDLLGTGEGGGQGHPIRFAGAAVELELTESVTFQATDMCFVTCVAKHVDLTSIVPAGLQVELQVEADGYVVLDIAGQDTHVLEVSTGTSGATARLNAVVVRGEAGTVLLALRSYGLALGSGQATHTSHVTARAGTHPDVVVPWSPVALRLADGEAFQVEGDEIEDVIVFQDGLPIARIDEEPYTFQANDTTEYTVLVLGQEAVRFSGANTTLTARRMHWVEGEPRAIALGQALEMTLHSDVPPIMVGVAIDAGDTPPMGVGSFVRSYSVQVRGPDGSPVAARAAECLPACGIVIVGGGDWVWVNSEFLAPGLVAGDYAIRVEAEGTNLAAYAWHTVIV